MQRVAIIFDGRRWYVRRVRLIEHDLQRDEMVYRCDKPIANDIKTAELALSALRGAWGRIKARGPSRVKGAQ